MPESPPVPLWRRAVSYGAVGGTQAEDLLKYPPAGYRPMERTARLGHGAQRWEHAWTETLTFGIQRRSGMRVERVVAPDEATDDAYVPVTFHDGTPVAPASTRSGEIVYTGTGEEVVRPGESAVLRIGWGRLSIPAPLRVVYVVDEPRRRGFAYGTLPGHPERGEESFVVEHREDDSVWLTVRAFSRPAHPALWLGYPVLRIAQATATARYLAALAGPLE